MTFVDDSLTGALPVRGGKSGAKGAKQAETAAQKDAFNQAFSEAGKKQPQISIREKSTAESTGTQSRISIQNTATTEAATTATSSGEQAVAQDVNTKTFRVPGNTVADVAAQEQLPPDLPQVPVELEAVTSALPDEKTIPTAEATAKPEPVKTRTETLTAVIGELDQSQAITDPDVASDTLPAIDTDVAHKLAEMFKERQSQVAKSQTGEKLTTAKEQSDSKNTQAAATADADVDQLLVMLGAPQAQVQEIEAPVQTSSALSEFQALADRAGKSRPASKEPEVTPKTGQAAGTTTHAAEAVSVPGTEADVETDQVFRFARADGKGQDVSMAISADGDKATIDTSGTPAAKAETVTVLEARRYLGIAPSSNAQAVTTAIAGDAEWAQSIQQTSTTGNTTQQQATGKVLNTLKIQMHPIDLGMVTATLRLKDDELQVDLKVETGDAFRQLRDDQGDIVKALRAQGFAVDKVNVVFNAPDSNSNNGAQQQQSQGQAGGQQTGREASAGNSGTQGREQRNDGGNQQSQGERWTANETTGDPSTADAGRAGNIYM